MLTVSAGPAKSSACTLPAVVCCGVVESFDEAVEDEMSAGMSLLHPISEAPRKIARTVNDLLNVIDLSSVTNGCRTSTRCGEEEWQDLQIRSTHVLNWQ